MPQRSLTIRFYLAQKMPSQATFNWGAYHLRALVRAGLPAVGANGQPITLDGETFLIEQAPGSGEVVHALVSVDMEQVPSVRVGQHTGVLTLGANQIPALTTHVLFFPCGVVGVIRPALTSALPRVSSHAISSATGVPVGLSPLVREDQMTVLNGAVGVSRFELDITDVAPNIADADGIYAAARLLQGTRLEGTIKLVAKSNADKTRLLTRVRETLEHARQGHFRIKRAQANTLLGGGLAPRLVDLLDDEIVQRVTVQLTQVGPMSTLTAAEVFTAACDAYNDLDTVLGAALAATPSDFAMDQ